MDRLRPIVAVLSGALAAASLAAAALIVVNAASIGGVELQRLREPTLVFWLCLLAVVAVQRDRRAAWRSVAETVERRLGSPRAFGVVLAAGGALLVASSVTHHLAFDTYSHDLGMYQEVLAHAWASPPLESHWLGGSFLGEHFSPVLFVLAPVYRLAPSPLTLVVLGPLLLWVAAFPLAAIGRELGLSRAVVNLLCAVYLCFPTVARAAGYPFHHEALYPAIFFGLYLAFLRDRRLVAGVLALAAVAVKEDAGLYLAGVGLFLGLHHRRWRWGAAVAIFGVVSTAAAVLWLIPHFAGDGAGYGFHGRWARWIEPAGVAPAVRSLVTAVFTEDVLTVIAATVLLPFRARWTWTVIAVPFLLNLTSANPNQAQLSLYYGLPVAATAAIAAAAALAARPLDRRPGVTVAAVALVVNVAAFTYPAIPAARDAVVAELETVDPSATVAMSGCFDPLLQRVGDRRLLRPDHPPDSDVVLLKTSRHTWPLSRQQAAALAARLDTDPRYRVAFRREGFVFYRRQVAGEPGSRRMQLGKATPTG